MTQKKGKHVRLYVLEEDEAPLEKLATATGLTQTMVLTFIVSAGLKACAAAGNRMPLPLEFDLTEHCGMETRLNEPRTKYPPRKAG